MKAIRNSKGFTLIELLVVVAIIGILAAIAIPQFALYRARGFTSRAASDAHNSSVGQEAIVADGKAYVGCSDSGCNHPALPGFRISDGVTLVMTGGTVASYTGDSSHSNGCPLGSAGKVHIDSAAGGVVATSYPTC